MLLFHIWTSHTSSYLLRYLHKKSHLSGLKNARDRWRVRQVRNFKFNLPLLLRATLNSTLWTQITILRSDFLHRYIMALNWCLLKSWWYAAAKRRAKTSVVHFHGEFRFPGSYGMWVNRSGDNIFLSTIVHYRHPACAPCSRDRRKHSILQTCKFPEDLSIIVNLQWHVTYSLHPMSANEMTDTHIWEISILQSISQMSNGRWKSAIARW